MNKKKVIISILLSMTLFLTGCKCDHIWTETRCTTPRKCSRCGEYEDVKPKGHNYGSTDIYYDIEELTVKSSQYCLHCGDVKDLGTEPLTKLHADGEFLFTGEEYINRMNHVLSDIGYSDMNVDILDLSDINWYFGSIGTETAAYARVEFSGEYRVFDEGNLEPCVIYTTIETDDVAMIGRILIATLVTCDPTLDTESAADLMVKIINSSSNGKPYYHNGIGYAVATEGEKMKFVASVYVPD